MKGDGESDEGSKIGNRTVVLGLEGIGIQWYKLWN
jgi:hypothetical protein